MKTTDRWAALYLLITLILGALFAQGFVLKRLDSRRDSSKGKASAQAGAGASDTTSTLTLQAPEAESPASKVPAEQVPAATPTLSALQTPAAPPRAKRNIASPTPPIPTSISSKR